MSAGCSRSRKDFATKFAFTVNRKAAAGLGLTLSRTLLAGADEVIE